MPTGTREVSQMARNPTIHKSSDADTEIFYSLVMLFKENPEMITTYPRLLGAELKDTENFTVARALIADNDSEVMESLLGFLGSEETEKMGEALDIKYKHNWIWDAKRELMKFFREEALTRYSGPL